MIRNRCRKSSTDGTSKNAGNKNDNSGSSSKKKQTILEDQGSSKQISNEASCPLIIIGLACL